MYNHHFPLDALCECGHTNLDHVGSEPGYSFTPCFKCPCMGFVLSQEWLDRQK